MKDKEKNRRSGGAMLVMALLTLGSIVIMVCKMLVKIWEGMWH